MPQSTKWNAPPALCDYVARIGGEVLNWRRAMVKVYGVSEQGRSYYVEKTLIKITDDGGVELNRGAPVEHYPTDDERDAIKKAYLKAEFPRASLQTINNAIALRKRLKVPQEKWFIIVAALSRGEVLMCQERVDLEDGSKFYRPWTYFSKDGDGDWLSMEPGTRLPFWKPHERRHLPFVMVHEGSKAASYVDWLINDPSIEANAARAKHPWYDYLRNYEHWGINGGALAPHRADYEELRLMRPRKVAYCCDRDHPGESALQKVSEYYRDTMIGLVFDQRFKENWDMADPLPEKFFIDGSYVGPELREMEEPATWVTDMVPIEGTKKFTAVLRQKFKEEWFHVIQPECYVGIVQPTFIYITAAAFNNKVQPFSDVENTARLLKSDNASKMNTLCYTPSSSAGPRALKSGGHAFNTHLSSDIRPKKGDPERFLDYVSWLLPIHNDKIEILRWCATLIARPDLKMNYAPLLCSEQQGVGKTTLGQNILGPIIGLHNMKTPSIHEILDSQFTGWKSRARLILINEIFENQSVRAYDRLKSLITDTIIEVNEKYMSPYTIQNWAHIMALSNHLNALRLPDDDRRWLVPKVTEQLRSDQYWLDFNRWLLCEGLSVIMHWASEFLKTHRPILPSERAPISTAKMHMIEAGWSPGKTLIHDTLFDLNGNGPVVVTDSVLQDLIKHRIWDGRTDKMLERLLTIAKVARTCGWHVGEERVNVIKGQAKARLISNVPELVQMSWAELSHKQKTGEPIRMIANINDFGI
jgi:Family of unknown function (DUF5906)